MRLMRTILVLVLLTIAAPANAQPQTSTTHRAHAWQCQIGAICIEVAVVQTIPAIGAPTTTLWYRVEDTATWTILAGTLFSPVVIDNAAFVVSTNGKTATLDHPEAFVVWQVTNDKVRRTDSTTTDGGTTTYERTESRLATAVGTVAAHELNAAHRTNASGNPIDGAQLDVTLQRVK